VKVYNSVGVSFDEKSEKYKVLDNDGKEKVKSLLDQIKDLRGILERKRSERAPVQAAKDEALKKIRQIFEKLKDEKKKLPNRLQPLPQLRENDEKAFNVREEKGKEKEGKKEVKEETLDAESLTKRRTDLDELKKLVSTVSAETWSVVNSEEKLKAEKKKEKKKSLEAKLKADQKQKATSLEQLQKMATQYPPNTEIGGLVATFIQRASGPLTKKDSGDFNTFASSVTQTIFKQMTALLAQIKDAKSAKGGSSGKQKPKDNDIKAFAPSVSKGFNSSLDLSNDNPQKDQKKSSQETPELKAIRKQVLEFRKEKKKPHMTDIRKQKKKM